MQRHDINKKQLNVELLKPKTMKKKYLIMVATAIFATISINLQAQEDLVGSGDRSVTTDYWSRQGDGVGGTSSNRLGTTDGYPIRFCTKNVDRIFIDTAGRVGINTSMPLQRLHVLDGNDQIISRKIVINSAL